MDAYEYALMKETIECIQTKVNVWRYTVDTHPVDSDYMALEILCEIETMLDEAGFHE